MTIWWNCPKCTEVTDEFESSKYNECPKCRENIMTRLFQNRFYKVENKNKHHNAVEWYFFCRTVNGKDYFFTKATLDEANIRAEKNQEDIPNNIISINPEEVYNEKEYLAGKVEKLEYELDIEKRTAKIWRYLAIISVPLCYALGSAMHSLIVG